MSRFSPAVSWKVIFKTIFSLVFFAGYYFYFKTGVNMVLSYQWQEPTFFCTGQFLREFLAFPGGLTQYVANFIAQFYYIPWAGAAIITLSAWLLCRITVMIVARIFPDMRLFFLYYLPAILLIPVHSLYKHPYEFTLALLLSLTAFLLYIRFSPRNPLLKSIIAAPVLAILYYVVGGAFYLYVVLCVLYDLFISRTLTAPVLSAIVAAALPFIATQVFIITASDAFLSLLPFSLAYKPIFAAWLLYGYYILLIPGLVFARSKTKAGTGLWNRLAGFGAKLQNQRGWLVKGAALILLAVLYALISFNRQTKVLLLADNYAQNKEWVQVLDIARERVTNHRLVAFHSNRALYFTGHLANNMFSLSQERSSESLVMSREFASTAPLQCSQFYLELGMVNEAQHWAHEALALKKESPWILQQLVIISLLKEDYAFAQVCLNKIKTTILFKDWAQNWQHYVDNPQSINTNVMLKNIRAIQVNCDYFIRTNEIRDILEFVSTCSKNNRMAFEYLMACYLITGRLDEVIANIPRLKEFNYQYIPRHYEEAILLSAMRKGGEINLGEYKINSSTRARFKDYNNILIKYPSGKVAARKELAQKHGNTYWYYVMYN
ncbi:MAG TPA: DUF6057 family protein [bacterium]|nr:DUF6057 family protein [bacterium]HPN45941.1 DUF6057 family protein [bacterium]